MKNTRLQARSLIVALILLALTSLGVKAEENAGGFLSDLHVFRINNYMALDAYYRFSAAGDTETLNEIVAGVNAANDAMNVMIESSGSFLSAEQIESLNLEFDKFKNLMRNNINDVRKNGYPDLRLMSDMANQALAMNNMATDLHAIAQNNSGAGTNPRMEAARSAAVKIAQMMAKYSARSNSSVFQNFQGAATEQPLDEHAKDFDQLLDQVKQDDGNEQLGSVLEDVSSKWQFIRGSYINYNDKNVAFVIDRYSKGILKGLASAIELLHANA